MTPAKTVPYKHAQLLFEKAGEPKELWTVPNGQHTDALGSYFEEFAPKLIARFKSWVSEKQ